MKRAGIDQPVKLIPELCKFTGLTENEKANFRFMAVRGSFKVPWNPIVYLILFQNVGNFTRSDPPKRVQMLRAFGKNLLEKKEVVVSGKLFEILPPHLWVILPSLLSTEPLLLHTPLLLVS